MISRGTAAQIQRLYQIVFCEDEANFGVALLNKDKLYMFLYEDYHEAWFLDIIRRRVETADQLKHFILDLHTGHAYVSKTHNMDQKRERGQGLLKALAVSMLKILEPDLDTPSLVNYPNEALAIALKLGLELDGYIWKNRKLIAVDSSVIDEVEEQNLLEQLIDDLAFPATATIKHHLELAQDAYIDGRWSDTISNARNFFEAILKEIAEALHAKLNGAPLTLQRPVEIREYLESTGFVDRTEKESISRVYGLISNTGSHPNMAHQDQARLMRNLALTFSQYLLLQWTGYLKANP